MVPAFRPPPPERAPGIADHFISDRPITAGDPDPLQRRSIADALSRFLRNENTEPPLTIAITGDWGDGKSSLMNLLQADLEEHGTKTVWFNAWHHQKEKHLFAALLQAVRDQAIPSIWRLRKWEFLRALKFRRRLLWSRAWRHKPSTIVALALIGLSLGSALATDPHRMIERLATKTLETLRITLEILHLHTKPLEGLNIDLPPFLPPSLAVLIAVCVASAAPLKRSGANPGRLMAAASGAFRVKRFGGQLGFRHRFGDAYKEVTEALRPKTLLILIDDLDRCRPEQVVEILEAMNFLVNKGRCYIVMGIALDQVMHCVGLGFKDIAAEAAEIRDGGRRPEAWRRKKRRDYARDYLAKLINLEIPIPKLTDAGAAKLAEAASGPAAGRERPSELRRSKRHVAKVLVGCLVGSAILGSGVYFGLSTSQTATESTATESTATESTATESTATESTATERVSDTGTMEPTGPGEATTEAPSGSFVLGAKDVVPWWSSHLPAGLLTFATVIAITLLRLRRQEERIQDSRAFTDALKIWHPLILATTKSPRQMKRFINRVRYLAMASRVEAAAAESVVDEEVEPSSKSETFRESELVALSTLQDLEKDLVLASLRRTNEEPPVAENNEIDQTLEEHHEKFKDDEITEEVFDQFLAKRKAH